MKKSDAALVTINKAMNIDPKNPLCKFHRASILFSMDKHKVWSSSSSPLILGRGRQLVQDLISSSKRKVRECIVCEATVLLSTSSQVYTIIGISYKWGLYDKNHVTSFVLRCAIFAKKTLPVMLTAVAFFPAKIGQFRARLIYHNWMYGTGKFYTRSRISMSQMCFKTAALIR